MEEEVEKGVGGREFGAKPIFFSFYIFFLFSDS